jgi:glycosyltransferase involved in cell wall biosynthesis
MRAPNLAESELAAGFLIDADPTGTVFSPKSQTRPAVFFASKENPLVSCVMVSRGNVEILRHSVGCLLRQTYENLELVVILQDMTPSLRSYFDSIKNAGRRVRIYTVPPALKLGDLRNMAIARARGTLICQWDDDDLHHSRYLDYMVGFMEANGVGVAFLKQWTIWWPGRRQFALSKYQLWEGSIVADRSFIPIYPSLEKREDAFVTKAMVRQRAIVAVEAPQLYVYTVTGENTWDERHMESMSEGEGSARCVDEDYDPIFDRLDSLYGVADYQSYCLNARGKRESKDEWSGTSSM